MHIVTFNWQGPNQKKISSTLQNDALVILYCEYSLCDLLTILKKCLFLDVRLKNINYYWFLYCRFLGFWKYCIACLKPKISYNSCLIDFYECMVLISCGSDHLYTYQHLYIKSKGFLRCNTSFRIGSGLGSKAPRDLSRLNQNWVQHIIHTQYILSCHTVTFPLH